MEKIQLTDIFFVDREYSRRHPHMLHRHADVLELLYIFSESGRYIVGNYEYAVTTGDFVICKANVPHGEDPFQEHHIQTYFFPVLLREVLRGFSELLQIHLHDEE